MRATNGALGNIASIASLLVGCQAAARSDRQAPAFEVDQLQWSSEATEASFSYTGRALVRQTAGDSGTYLLFARAIKVRGIDPGDVMDTVETSTFVIRGRGELVTTDYASRCSEYLRRECIVRVAQAPETRMELFGWVRIEPMASRADVSH